MLIHQVGEAREESSEQILKRTNAAVASSNPLAAV